MYLIKIDCIFDKLKLLTTGFGGGEERCLEYKTKQMISYIHFLVKQIVLYL